MVSLPAPKMIKTNGIDMAVYEAGPKDGVPDNPRAWLLRIMTNSYRDRYRREARSLEVAGSVDLDRLDSAAPSREPGPDRLLESKLRVADKSVL